MHIQQRMAEIDTRIAARKDAIGRKLGIASAEEVVAAPESAVTASSCDPPPVRPQEPIATHTENDPGTSEASAGGVLLGDKCYRILKYTVLIGLPAVGPLYFGLSKIWGFPYGEEVVGTLTVVCTFIGTLIGVSSLYYYKQ